MDFFKQFCIYFTGLLRKKLNFDFVDNCDLDYHDEADYDDEDEENLPKKLRFNQNGDTFESGDCSIQSTPSTEFSPGRTRSGRIYIAGGSSAEKPKKLPTPTFRQKPKIELNLLQKDLAKSAPPPLNYSKRPVSR